jgi:hypothetical protein
MNLRPVYLMSVFMLLPSAHAAESEKGRFMAKPLKGDYYVYGGSIGEKTPPTPKDRKLSLMLTGLLAKELFDHIGPDMKAACGAGPDHRERNKGDLVCLWTKEDGYACYVGLDMRTGKSMIGVSC